MSSERVAFSVYGVTREGLLYHREGGATVWCGHRHKSEELCAECLERMRARGECPEYRVLQVKFEGLKWTACRGKGTR